MSKAQMLKQLPLVQQLSPQITRKSYADMLGQMLQLGYRMVGVFDGKKCIAISGFWVGVKLYSGKYLEPDNVIVHKKYRSSGIGKILLKWLEAEAARSGCSTIMLDAYLENIQGHKFYWREGFTARGFHFLKKI